MIETDDGYAVWDDIRDEIYVDSEGVCETFPSEWQAEDYLEQVRKAVSKKEAAEWLYVERAKDTAAEQPVEPATQPAITDAEFAAQNLVPGETVFEIDGRTFLVDRVDTAHGVVNFQDITFVQKVGFPIFRTEPISFVRKIVEQADPAALALPQPQTDEPPAVLTPPKKKKQNALAYPLDTDGRNYRITDDHIGEGAPLERFQRNLDAIRTLKAIEAENRTATAEEQAVLAQYVGWGGLPDAFDPDKDNWAKEYTELKGLLSEDEYAAARSSVLNAHYRSIKSAALKKCRNVWMQQLLAITSWAIPLKLQKHAWPRLPCCGRTSSITPGHVRFMMPTAKPGTVRDFWKPTGKKSRCIRLQKLLLMNPD